MKCRDFSLLFLSDLFIVGNIIPRQQITRHNIRFLKKAKIYISSNFLKGLNHYAFFFVPNILYVSSARKSSYEDLHLSFHEAQKSIFREKKYFSHEILFLKKMYKYEKSTSHFPSWKKIKFSRKRKIANNIMFR